MLIKEKGILAKLLERGIKIILIKECKRIGQLKIDIIASSLQILKGIIQKIHIFAKDITYKDLFFDEIELETNEVKIFFKIYTKELRFNNNFALSVKILLSENSLRNTLISENWNWIGDLITKEIFNQNKFEDIKIKNDQILIKAFNKDKTISEEKEINIQAENGKIYLESKEYNRSMKIPMEDKVCIKSVSIHNNLIMVFAKSSISF